MSSTDTIIKFPYPLGFKVTRSIISDLKASLVENKFERVTQSDIEASLDNIEWLIIYSARWNYWAYTNNNSKDYDIQFAITKTGKKYYVESIHDGMLFPKGFVLANTSVYVSDKPNFDTVYDKGPECWSGSVVTVTHYRAVKKLL